MIVQMRDVAARAEVSTSSVSNYLNYPDRVRPRTAARIAKAIKELGYIPNTAARTLRSGSSQTIAHLTFEVNNPFFFDVAAGVEQRAAEAGYAVVLAHSSGDPTRQQQYLDLFESQRVAGILLSPVGDIEDAVSALQGRGVEVLLVDQAAPTSLCSSISVDDRAGGELAMNHLAEVGCRRVSFVGGPLGLAAVRARLEGARTVAVQLGIEFEVVEVPTRSIGSGREVGRQLAGRDPRGRPDGIFAANDLLAIGVLQGLLQQGSIAVPEDIAIVGFDDIEFAREALVPLSSVRRPTITFGRAALEMLLSQLGNPDAENTAVRFTPSLIPRASSVRPQ